MPDLESHCFWCENVMRRDVLGIWIDDYGDENCRFHPVSFDIITLKGTGKIAKHQDFYEVHSDLRSYHKMLENVKTNSHLRLVRHNANDTSINAAKSINVTKLETMILLAIKESGEKGMTADELRSHFPHLSYSSVTARPSSLKAKGLIFDSGRRRTGKSGRPQAVLIAN
jgi:hypothetical protein